MRIPVSVFVMSALTCLPFGLAIRDTLRGEDHHSRFGHDTDLDTDEDSAARMERRRQQRDDEERTEALAARDAVANKLTHDRLINGMIGARPARVGAALQGVAPGSKYASEMQRALDEINRTPDLSVAFTAPGGVIQDVTIASTASDDYGCESLKTPLAAWGEGGQLDFTIRVWTTPSGDRAVFDRDACKLVFDQYVPIEHFIDRTDTATVSFGVIGMSAAKLAVRLDGRADVDSDAQTIQWTERGLADGTGPTHLTAKTKAGKVIGLDVLGTTSAAAISALQARMTKLLGAPHKDDNDYDADRDTLLHWRGKLAATLYASGTTFRIELGDTVGE